LGAVSLPGVTSLADRLAAVEMSEGRGATAGSLLLTPRIALRVRPGHPLLEVSENGAWLTQCDVVVSPEQAEPEPASPRQPADLRAGGAHPAVAAFCEEVSRDFERRAATVPQYAALLNLVRLHAVLRCVQGRRVAEDAALEWESINATHPDASPWPQTPETCDSMVSAGADRSLSPSSAPANRRSVLICGGVQLDITLEQSQLRQSAETSARLQRLCDVVLASRAGSEQLYWTVQRR
jgi:hypothetical protein